jgi:hypothetical protein
MAPPERVAFDGFTVLPPSGQGWVAVNPPPLPAIDPRIRVRAYFVKSLAAPSSPAQLHRLTAVVRTIDLGDVRIENRWETLRSIARGFSGATGLGTCLGRDCASYASTTEDRSNPTFPNHTFVIDKRGFVVLHPDSPRLAVNVEYRQYYGGDVRPLSPEALEREVEPFQRSLQFTPLGTMR